MYVFVKILTVNKMKGNEEEKTDKMEIKNLDIVFFVKTNLFLNISEFCVLQQAQLYGCNLVSSKIKALRCANK